MAFHTAALAVIRITINPFFLQLPTGSKHMASERIWPISHLSVTKLQVVKWSIVTPLWEEAKRCSQSRMNWLIEQRFLNKEKKFSTPELSMLHVHTYICIGAFIGVSYKFSISLCYDNLVLCNWKFLFSNRTQCKFVYIEFSLKAISHCFQDSFFVITSVSCRHHIWLCMRWTLQSPVLHILKLMSLITPNVAIFS